MTGVLVLFGAVTGGVKSGPRSCRTRRENLDFDQLLAECRGGAFSSGFGHGFDVRRCDFRRQKVWPRDWPCPAYVMLLVTPAPVRTENPIRLDAAMESPKLAE